VAIVLELVVTGVSAAVEDVTAEPSAAAAAATVTTQINRLDRIVRRFSTRPCDVAPPPTARASLLPR
jgi:hypothetical protein